MMRRYGLCSMVIAAFLSTAGPAAAQNGGAPLASLLPTLVLRDISLPPAAAPGRPHESHFTPLNPLFEGLTTDLLAIPSVQAVLNVNRILASQFSTFPLGSSSGGFTYTFDEAAGTYARSTRSFGPAFAERATTIGRNRVSVGFNYQHSSFDQLAGEDLDDGSIKFYIPHNDCCPGQIATTGQAVGDGSRLNPAFGFEGDLIEAALSFKAKTDTFAVFASYGITDRWDIGVAVPVVRTDIDASVDASIVRLATPTLPLVHTFVEGQDVRQQTYSASGSNTGLGDIVVRTKVNALPVAGGGIGVGLDLRLPTGDENELAGTGTTQAKVYFVASSGNERVAQHFNVGYTFSGTSDDLMSVLTGGNTDLLAAFSSSPSVPDEFNYAGGVEFVATPRLTIVGDILGRTLRDVGKLEVVTKRFEYQPQGGPAVTPTPAAQFDEFESRAGNLNLLLGTAGVKVNVTGNLLLSAHMLFALNSSGLKPRPTPVIGLDYAF